MKISGCLLTLVTMTGACFAQRTITTLAGREVRFEGAGKLGKEAVIGTPRGIASDGNGNLFFTDDGFSVVLKLDTESRLSVIASQVATPKGIAAASDGSVYVATESGRIRRIAPDGSDSTIAGTGPNASDEGILAIEARLNNVGGLAIDREGNLYVAESGAHRVRRIGRDGTIRTVAGNGRAGFAGDGGPAVEATLSFPLDVAIDRDGGLLIADYQNGRIRRVDPATGAISTVAGGGRGRTGEGPAREMSLVGPSGVVAAPDGSFYIFDSLLITRVAADGIARPVTSRSTRPDHGDGGPAPEAYVPTGQLVAVSGMAVDSAGNLYLPDVSRSRVRRVDTNGIITTVAGASEYRFAGDGGPALQAAFNGPRSLAVSPNGTVHVLDRDNCRVRSIDPDGVIQTTAGNGVCASVFDPARGDQIEVAVEIGFGGASSIAAGLGDEVYIADISRIRLIGPNGDIRTVVNGSGRSGFGGDVTGTAFDTPITGPIYGMYIDQAGSLYFSEFNTHRVRKVTPDGIMSTFAGSGPVSGPGAYAGDGGPATGARLNQPATITGDAAGNIYILDTRNQQIRRVGRDGIITSVPGGERINALQGRFGFPGLAVDANGDLLVADTRTHRIVRLSSDGALAPIAGTGAPGFAGDGGDSEKAALNNPTALTVSAEGDLLVSDSGNHRIRRITGASR